MTALIATSTFHKPLMEDLENVKVVLSKLSILDPKF